ncbi:MAG: hypothetical protein N2515_07575, partial [Deltaproteobacteria bacterium]|nr:hypothetical protein [Deltaproteobacteria bacterium]
VILGVLRFVSRRFSDRSVKDLIQSAPPELRQIFDQGIEENEWYAKECFTWLSERIDAVHGRDDLRLVVEVGRAVAENAFETIRHFLPRLPQVEFLISKLPEIIGELFQGLSLLIHRVGRGHARIELDEAGTSSLTIAVVMLGFIERTLGRFGANEVEVNLLSARALDDPHTILEVSWLA